VIIKPNKASPRPGKGDVVRQAACGAGQGRGSAMECGDERQGKVAGGHGGLHHQGMSWFDAAASGCLNNVLICSIMETNDCEMSHQDP
jgi:hypothetical protein